MIIRLLLHYMVHSSSIMKFELLVLTREKISPGSPTGKSEQTEYSIMMQAKKALRDEQLVLSMILLH